MVREFWGSGIVAPRTPAHVIPKLRGEGYFLETEGVDLDPIEAYFLDPLPRYLATERPDYFVAGGRDNGYSSFWGFLVQAGGMFCAIQDTVGQAVLDPKQFTRGLGKYGTPFMHYNAELAQVADHGSQPLDLAVIFSTFRGQAMILCNRDRWWISRDLPHIGLGDNTWVDHNWGVVVDISRSEDSSAQSVHDLVSELDLGYYDDWLKLRAAVRFLVACLPRDDS